MRISFNVNLTPIGDKDSYTGADIPPIEDAAQLLQLELGLTPWFMVRDQDAARARVWSNDDGSFRPAYQLDWTRAIDPNALDPRHADSADGLYGRSMKQCGHLALYADTYWPGMNEPLPVMLDLESPTWSARLKDSAGVDETDAAFYDRYFSRLSEAIWNVGVGCGTNVTPEREGSQDRTPVGVFGAPDPWFTRNFQPDQAAALSGWRTYLNRVGYFSPGLYSVPNYGSDDLWFDMASKAIRDCRRHAPWMPIIPTVCPLYQKRGDADLFPSRSKLDGREIPPSLWRDMLKFLDDEGCGVNLWTPPTAEVSPMLGNLYQIAARRNPR